MSSRLLRCGVSSSAANDGEAEWDVPPRQPSHLSEIINSGEVNEQVGQDEVTGGQKQFRVGEEFGISDVDTDACSERDKWRNHNKDFLNMI